MGNEELESGRDIQARFSDGLVVASSRIEGEGLMVVNQFEPGDFILQFGGTLLAADQRQSKFVQPSTAIGVGDDVILAEVFDGPGKDYSDYINHSCDPTTGMADALTLIARTRLLPGDEVTMDYSWWEADIDWEMRVDCNCGAESCRRRVSALDVFDLSLEDPNIRFLSPFVRRRRRRLPPDLTARE